MKSKRGILKVAGIHRWRYVVRMLLSSFRTFTQVPLHGAKFNIDDDVAAEVNGALPHTALSDSQLYLILHNETTLRTSER